MAVSSDVLISEAGPLYTMTPEAGLPKGFRAKRLIDA